MGDFLPKPVSSKVLDRHCGKHMKVGVASMNGWRIDMEDSHTVVLNDKGGVLGVFDGHGGTQASRFLKDDLTELVEREGGLPEGRDALERMILDMDGRLLNSGVSVDRTGSTGVIAAVAHGPDDDYEIQICNVGDSRVLLGSCQSRDCSGSQLTNDHKPWLDEETKRIQEAGGTVFYGRVNGTLAISRAFGNNRFKQGPGGPSKQQVTALPEVVTARAKPGDFLILSCDGIFEKDFSSEQVVEYVHSCLLRNKDPAQAAAAVCEEALARGSRDNMTCVVALFETTHTEREVHQTEFIPGPFEEEHLTFVDAYKKVASQNGFSLGEALEKRYDQLRADVRLLEQGISDVSQCPHFTNREVRCMLRGSQGKADEQGGGGADDSDFVENAGTSELWEELRRRLEAGQRLEAPTLRRKKKELDAYGDGPGDLQGASRTQWFCDWVESRMEMPLKELTTRLSS
eukprot:Sspe_Gene.35118::Locus_17033_Transcript_2_2_Confidence_0.667_Length_1506::g.35118::m.35118/K04461/PPM1B, PP2CB; protein phosphatase 1B